MRARVIERPGDPRAADADRVSRARYREITPERVAEFVARGHNASRVFPHRVYYLPKCGPDGLKLAARMCDVREESGLWQLVLYATGSVVESFPADLFTDDDVNWHRQQYGRRGQIATANLVVAGRRLYSMVHQSDIVQRISRRREHKTRIENRFKGWVHMLLNAVANFALEKELDTLFVPTAVNALEHTDRRRNPGRELFERVYDRSVHDLFEVEREGGWWVIDVARDRARIVRPDVGEEILPRTKTICVCHDVERGLGHRVVEPAFAALADETSPEALAAMVAIEASAGVRATYSVVGEILEEVRPVIDGRGHAIAFHSFDHRPESSDQLGRCRQTDYRLKGYRLVQSRGTEETSDWNLLLHNFDWLASSAYSFGFDEPRLANRLVKLPILVDDFALHERRVSYEQWERQLFAAIDRRGFAAVGLHDCYAREWLPSYDRLLRRLAESGRLVTLDDVAAEVAFAHAF